MEYHKKLGFRVIKEYSATQKRLKALWIKALRHYYKTLFEKVHKSLQISKTIDFKAFWFRRLLEIHEQYQYKEEMIRRKHEYRIQRQNFELWYQYFKEIENYKHLVQTMTNFSTLKLKSKALKALYLNYSKAKRIAIAMETRLFKQKQRIFNLWNFYKNRRQFKALKTGKAYEKYYFTLISRAFFAWLPACALLREEERNTLLLFKVFKIWKEMYLVVDDQKRKIASVLRDQILQKVFFKGFKERVGLQKKTKIANNFHKYKLLMAWRLAAERKRYNKANKQKAKVWFKWKKLRKYFQKLWYNHRQEKRLSQEYADKAYLFQEKIKRRRVASCFRGLKNNLVLKHVDYLKNNKLVEKLFFKWSRYTIYAKIVRKRLKNFNAWRKYKKVYKAYYVFKQFWIAFKNEEGRALAFNRYQLKRKALTGWNNITKIESKQREFAGFKHYKNQLLQKAFYQLRFHLTKRRQQKKLEDKLDWFIEKKITKLLKGLLREWRKISYLDKKDRMYINTLKYKGFWGLKLSTRLSSYRTET